MRRELKGRIISTSYEERYAYVHVCIRKLPKPTEPDATEARDEAHLEHLNKVYTERLNEYIEQRNALKEVGSREVTIIFGDDTHDR